MGKYSDDEIRSCKKITLKIAADYLGISPLAVGLGMRNDLLPIGFAIKHEERYFESWGYTYMLHLNTVMNRMVQRLQKLYTYLERIKNWGLYLRKI